MKMAVRMQEITEANLKQTCWLNGYSITALARKLGYHRVTLYWAVKQPDRYPVAYQKIGDALPLRLNSARVSP
jgi:lambda repressor-like predicted transcriptional regulator